MDIDYRLYLITDRKQTSLPLPQAVRLACEGGARAVQVREKDLPIRELITLSEQLRAITGEFGAKLIINDRVDVAMAVGADGVHLGTGSMPPDAVRAMVGARMLIGCSTHSLQEATAAEHGGADFITFGPVFETPSKAQYGPPVGLEALREVKRRVNIPIFALGGIRGKNIGHVLWAGAYGVAMISAVFGVPDIKKAAKNLTEMIQIVDRSICVQCGRK